MQRCKGTKAQSKKMQEIKIYRDLIIWQKAIKLVIKTYKIAKSFLKEEVYSLTSQIRRSSISIPSNIAEGYGRKAKKKYTRFLQISLGSLFELQTQLEISFNLKYLDKNLFEDTRELECMRSSLIDKLK